MGDGHRKNTILEVDNFLSKNNKLNLKDFQGLLKILGFFDIPWKLYYRRLFVYMIWTCIHMNVIYKGLWNNFSEKFFSAILKNSSGRSQKSKSEASNVNPCKGPWFSKNLKGPKIGVPDFKNLLPIICNSFRNHNVNQVLKNRATNYAVFGPF